MVTPWCWEQTSPTSPSPGLTLITSTQSHFMSSLFHKGQSVSHFFLKELWYRGDLSCVLVTLRYSCVGCALHSSRLDPFCKTTCGSTSPGRCSKFCRLGEFWTPFPQMHKGDENFYLMDLRKISGCYICLRIGYWINVINLTLLREFRLNSAIFKIFKTGKY